MNTAHTHTYIYDLVNSLDDLVTYIYSRGRLSDRGGEAKGTGDTRRD